MKHCCHIVGGHFMCCWCGMEFAAGRPRALADITILLEMVESGAEHGTYRSQNMIAIDGDRDCPVRLRLAKLQAQVQVS